MSDIFLSYKSEDIPRAKIIAEALEQHRYSVWWDRMILPGKTFDQVIKEEINAANCVIVLWSKKSVESEWVKNEAREGIKRKILIPVLIEDVNIPFEFRHIQAANFTDWQGTLPNPEFDLLLKSVKEILRPFKPPIDEFNISAQKLFNEGNYLEAIITWRKVLNSDSENTLAIKGIKKAQKEINYQINSLISEARLLFGQNNYSGAIEKWNEVLNLDPENPIAIKEKQRVKKYLEITSKSEISEKWKWESMFAILAILFGYWCTSYFNYVIQNLIRDSILESMYMILLIVIFLIGYVLFEERISIKDGGGFWIFPLSIILLINLMFAFTGSIFGIILELLTFFFFVFLADIIESKYKKKPFSVVVLEQFRLL